MTENTETGETLKVGRRIIAFIGPEGSGKTTVAKKLAEQTGKPYVTTGDIIRNLAAYDEGPLGEECRVMFAEKKYLSGETLIRLLIHRFSHDDTLEGLILDGGLRTLEETLAFQAMLEEAGRNIPMTIIYMQIPESMTYERLVFGENARKRADDTEEGVHSRLEKFNHQLDERINVIMANPEWDLIPIDATADEESVYNLVKEMLGV